MRVLRADLSLGIWPCVLSSVPSRCAGTRPVHRLFLVIASGPFSGCASCVQTAFPLAYAVVVSFGTPVSLPLHEQHLVPFRGSNAATSWLQRSGRTTPSSYMCHSLFCLRGS